MQLTGHHLHREIALPVCVGAQFSVNINHAHVLHGLGHQALVLHQHQRAAHGGRGGARSLGDLQVALTGHMVVEQVAVPAAGGDQVVGDGAADLATRGKCVAGGDGDVGVRVVGAQSHKHVRAQQPVGVWRVDMHVQLADADLPGGAGHGVDVVEDGVRLVPADDPRGRPAAALGHVGHHLGGAELDVAGEDGHGALNFHQV